MHGPSCIFWADLTPLSLQVYAPGDVPKKYEATGQLSSTARKVGLELGAVI